MNVNGIEFFDDLIEIHNEQNSITDKYPKLRSLLDQVCKDLTSNESIQFSNLFSRLNYVCEKTNLDRRKTFQINTLRINANNVLHSDFKPTQEDYLQNLKALCNALSHFYSIDIPKGLSSILPKTDYYKPKQRQGKKYDRIRVEVSSTDEQFIYAFDEENPTEEPIKIKHHVSGINEEFNSTVAKLWKGCQLNLIDVTVDEQGIYLPEFLVFEPDYLIDISSLAEVFKDYGNHPLNYLQSKFNTIPNTSAIILGNFANNVFDEFLFADKSNIPIVKNIFSKTFKQYPFEFSTCTDLYDSAKELKFKEDVKLHFVNIQKTVIETFNEDSYKIDRNKAVVEPSFICEKLEIQGRLDFLEENFKILIELKSGRADDFKLPLKSKQNNYIQMMLYLAVLEYNLGKSHKETVSYLFYSRYPQLYKEYPAWSWLKKTIDTRNQIIINEFEIGKIEGHSNFLIDKLTPEELNTKNLNNNLWNNYQKPQIIRFKEVFNKSALLELEYFNAFYQFTTKEHVLSKLQSAKLDEERPTSYWIDFNSKKENGGILYDLSIKEVENKTTDKIPKITLLIPDYDQEFLPNFREGDLVALYQRNNDSDNITNKQVFKGAIENLNNNEITIRLRYKQRNQSVLPQNSKYAVEHDFLDSSYNSMYRGLYAFLQANPDRKNLLLNQRQPLQDITQTLANTYISTEVNEIILKAKQAKDYFLLIGPPGTGKTSFALKSMVEEFYCEPSNNILLLSYTNRAVDEICDALDNVEDNPPYIRIGSELSCELKHRKKLLEKVIEHCEKRDDVKAEIQKHRIFVGTVASLSSKTELFKLKHFQIAIIDEASQILEPSLIGVLSAKNANGGNAIDKFILIGDHKQLPAVVLQKEEDSKVSNPLLNQIGLSNRRNSLFERLYLHKSDKHPLVWGMLHEQWRMHPDISLFPNYSFYKSELINGKAEHQQEKLQYKVIARHNPFQRLITSKRIAFIPSEKHKADKTNKTNTYEAKIAKQLVKQIFDLHKANNLKFSPEETIGIITPYRSQIALIKREICDLNIPELNTISVDTVERFQGSQRDIIIYSFCVNHFGQLDFLTSNTIEDEGQVIDRKLNVAITRAKKQLFVIGNPSILSNNLTYYRFIEFIRSKSGYIQAKPEDFLNGNFKIEEPDTDIEIGGNIYTPDENFKSVFDQLVINPLRLDNRTPQNESWYKNVLGNDSDFNRMNLIGFGRSDFSKNQESLFGYTLPERVNLYCYYNMRKHYFSSVAIFKSFYDYFKTAFTNSNSRITFIDFGCGPLTSGLAFNQSFASIPNFHFDYVGVDISSAMLNKAKEFSETGLFNRDTKFQFVKSLNDISESYWESVFTLSNTVILNFSYLFGNLPKDDTEKLAVKINSLLDKYPLNKFVLVFQNSSMEKRNRSYVIFKRLVPRLQSVIEYPKTETVVYRNAIMSNFDKSEIVYYELLSN